MAPCYEQFRVTFALSVSNSDPVLAREAEATSGHPVITGDVLRTPFPLRPTHAFMNPPFDMKFIESLLALLHRHFEDGNFATTILPAYALQTSRTVERIMSRWSIEGMHDSARYVSWFGKTVMSRNVYERARA